MRVRRWILPALVAVGGLVAGWGWALASPVGATPDENYHLTSIWCVERGDGALCEDVQRSSAGERRVQVAGLVGFPECFAFVEQESAACQDTLRARVTTTAVNDGAYPWGFYRTMHLFADDDVTGAVLTMRVVNAAIAVGLLTAVYLLGTGTTRRLLVYAVLPVLVPLGIFLIASVNPTGWTTTGMVAYAFALHSHLLAPTGARRWLTVVPMLIGLVMAVSSRGDAAVYVLLTTLALGVLHASTVRRHLTLLAAPALSALVAVVAALSSAQVANVAGAGAESQRPRGDVLVNLALEGPRLLSGVFGFGFGLGWLDTPMPAVTALGGLVVFGFLVLAGLGRGGRSKTIALVVLAGATAAIPLLTLFRLRLVIGESVQPRYILPLLPVVLLLAMVGPRVHEALRLSGLQAVAVYSLLVLGHAAAVYANVRRYVTGTDGPPVVDQVEWWWSTAPPPVAVWLIASIGFAVLALPLIGHSGPARERSTMLTGTTETRRRWAHDDPGEPVGGRGGHRAAG